MKFITSSKLSNYIHQTIGEVEIFAHYLDIPISEIYKCINDKNYRINNPLRNDEHPSLGFQYFKNKGTIRLYGKDWANPYYVGDIYYFVGIIIGLDCNVPIDFIKICKHILATFGDREPKAVSRPLPHNIERIHEIKSIDIEERSWNDNDFVYWNQFGIGIDELNRERIFPCEKFWIDDILQDYFYEVGNPCYAYYLGVNRGKKLWEIYRPLEVKYNKFRTNNNSDLKELYTIRPNTNLIITKSKKDKTLINKLLLDLDYLDTSVLYMSESGRLRSHSRTLIKENYQNVFVNFDIDKAGFDSMRFFKLQYHYNLFPFLVDKSNLINNYPKDITDFCKRFGYKNTKIVFNYLYKKYINEKAYSD